MAEVQIPVFHLDRNGARVSASDPAQSFCYAAPCIEIGFLYSADLWHGLSKQVDATKVTALIDTGADMVYVDRSLVQKYDCPPAIGGQAMTTNNLPADPAREGQLFIIENARAFNMWVQPRDFAAERAPYRMVLGRRFLQFCRLTWDGPRREARLTFLGNSAAY